MHIWAGRPNSLADGGGMEPRYLRQLAEIVDLGSLSLAAKSLSVTQPTLSRNIKSLEAMVGAPVLQRGRYGVTPTAIGTLLAREGRTIRSAVREANLSLGHWKGSLDGRLKIGAGTMVAHSLIPQFLARMSHGTWKVALRIEVERPAHLIDRVRAHELDAAIVQIDPYFSQDGLTQIPLVESKLSYYAGAKHPLARKKHVTERDIGRAMQIAFGAFGEAHAASVDDFTQAGLPGPTIELSGDLSIALHLLSTGTSIAILPDFIMRHLCDERPFVRLAYQGGMPSRTLSIWHREDMDGHPLIRDFCRRFGAYAASLQEGR